MSEGSEGNQQSPNLREEGINKLVKDYCLIIGVEGEASPEDIKKAFRRLALRYHLDHNPANAKEVEDRFKEMNEAYGALWAMNRIGTDMAIWPTIGEARVRKFE